jgi:hypothetical protein
MTKGSERMRRLRGRPVRMDAAGMAGCIGWNYGTNVTREGYSNKRGSLPAGNGVRLQKRRKTPIHRFSF